jgi:hypothetical protein
MLLGHTFTLELSTTPCFVVWVLTVPNSSVLTAHSATCVKDGFITEKNVVEVLHICIDLFQHEEVRSVKVYNMAGSCVEVGICMHEV